MQVDVHEAAEILDQLLELIDNGETIVITRDGQPLAQLTLEIANVLLSQTPSTRLEVLPSQAE